MAEQIEFCDSHGHLCPERPEEWADLLVENMRANAVARAVLTGVGIFHGNQDEMVLRAWQRHPRQFIPFLCEIDMDDSASKGYIDENLPHEPWGGIGEVYLNTSGLVHAQAIPLPDGSKRPYRYPVPGEGTESETLNYAFEKCADTGKPIFIHCEQAARLWTMLQRHPDTPVLWAHVGYVTPPEDVRFLLERSPNLTCDVGPGLRISVNEVDAGNPMPSLHNRIEAISELLREFPDRFTLGSDIIQWPKMTPAAYAKAFALYREILSKLPRDAANRIASGNFRRIVTANAAEA